MKINHGGGSKLGPLLATYGEDVGYMLISRPQTPHFLSVQQKLRSAVKFRPFGDTKTNFKKIGWPRPEKSKLEKGWFGSKHSNTTLRVGKKQGLLNLLACHLAISWG